MTNIKQILEQLKEINQWCGYMNKERFISYAKAKYPFDDKEAEALWKMENLMVETVQQLQCIIDKLEEE